MKARCDPAHNQASSSSCPATIDECPGPAVMGHMLWGLAAL